MRNKQGKSFVLIMIIIGISALILSVIVEQLIRINIEQNESRAQATLKIISTALEAYAADNNGAFPIEESALTQAKVPYLDRSYCGEYESGYTYLCQLDPSGYTLTSRPVDCSVKGTKSFTMVTGGVLTTDASCQVAGSEGE